MIEAVQPGKQAAATIRAVDGMLEYVEKHAGDIDVTVRYNLGESTDGERVIDIARVVLPDLPKKFRTPKPYIALDISPLSGRVTVHEEELHPGNPVAILMTDAILGARSTVYLALLHAAETRVKGTDIEPCWSQVVNCLRLQKGTGYPRFSIDGSTDTLSEYMLEDKLNPLAYIQAGLYRATAPYYQALERWTFGIKQETPGYDDVYLFIPPTTKRSPIATVERNADCITLQIQKLETIIHIGIDHDREAPFDPFFNTWPVDVIEKIHQPMVHAIDEKEKTAKTVSLFSLPVSVIRENVLRYVSKTLPPLASTLKRIADQKATVSHRL